MSVKIIIVKKSEKFLIQFRKKVLNVHKCFIMRLNEINLFVLTIINKNACFISKILEYWRTI